MGFRVWGTVSDVDHEFHVQQTSTRPDGMVTRCLKRAIRGEPPKHKAKLHKSLNNTTPTNPMPKEATLRPKP